MWVGPTQRHGGRRRQVQRSVNESIRSPRRRAAFATYSGQNVPRKWLYWSTYTNNPCGAWFTEEVAF